MLCFLCIYIYIFLWLQYFKRKQGLPYEIYRVLKENDFDSREKCDLKKVMPCIHVLIIDAYLFE